MTRFLLFYQFRLSGRLTGNDGWLHLCARGDEGRFVHRLVLVQLRYPANLRRGTQPAVANHRLPLAGSLQLHKDGRFFFLVSAPNTEDKHDNAPPASVPVSSAVRRGPVSSSSAGERSGVCHPAERVNAPRSPGLQSSHLRAQKRAGELGSDTAHPGASLSEDLWEVDVLIPADSVCLPGTCPPSQPAPQPAASLSPRLSAEPCKLGALVGMCSHPSHLTSELHISLARTRSHGCSSI